MSAQVPSNDQRHASAATAEPESHVVIDITDSAMALPGELRADHPTERVGTVLPEPALLHPLALLVVVNMLNVVDAALTIWWIELGIAVEGNPIVVAIGFPAKVVGVGLGSYVVYRLRPRWLLVPLIGLALVCLYHVVGSVAVLRS